MWQVCLLSWLWVIHSGNWCYFELRIIHWLRLFYYDLYLSWSRLRLHWLILLYIFFVAFQITWFSPAWLVKHLFCKTLILNSISLIHLDFHWALLLWHLLRVTIRTFFLRILIIMTSVFWSFLSLISIVVALFWLISLKIASRFLMLRFTLWRIVIPLGKIWVMLLLLAVVLLLL